MRLWGASLVFVFCVAMASTCVHSTSAAEQVRGVSANQVSARPGRTPVSEAAVAANTPDPPAKLALDRARAVPTRQLMMQSLRSDPAYSKSLGAEAAQSGPQSTTPRARPGVVGATQSPTASVTAITSALLPNSPSGFNWSAGVRFSPTAPGPKYNQNGKAYNLGTIFTGGARMIPGIGLSDMATLGVEFLGSSSRVVLFLELPPGQASYMVAINLADGNGKPVSAIASSVTALACDKSGGGQAIKLVPLSDGTGLVGVCNIVPMQSPNGVLSYEARKYWGMNCVSAFLDMRIGGVSSSPSLIWHPGYLLLGGITVTRI